MSTKARVFVSSVVEGFREFRQAVREGITAAGGDAVLVNEDFPALAASSRNVCLDAVDSSDIYIAVIGERGGWTTPSGKLVVEEEYERARQRRLPILVFVQRGNRDADASQFLVKLSDYVTALFRREFSTPDELRAEVERALSPLVHQTRMPMMNASVITERLAQPRRSDTLRLRFALLPERDEEVVDPVRLGEADFVASIHELAHRRDVRLFDYAAPKESELRRTTLLIRQNAGGRWGERPGGVDLEISASGLIFVEADVVGDRAETPLGFSGMVILQGDVEKSLRASFAFANAWYSEHDPYRRHQRFYYGVALTGLQYRRWVTSVPQGNSFTMGMGSTSDPYLVFDRPRLIGWTDLGAPDEEIQRIVTLAARELG